MWLHKLYLVPTVDICQYTSLEKHTGVKVKGRFKYRGQFEHNNRCFSALGA